MQHFRLPSEILLNVLYQLDGDHKTISSLSKTCHLLRDTLKENEARIAAEISFRLCAGPMQFLLGATASTSSPPTFAWLHDAYARGHAIECLTNALENIDIYSNQSIFGTPFSIYGRPLTEADYSDVRRYMMTCLLAVELSSWSWKTKTARYGSTQMEPEWISGLALHAQDLIRHLTVYLHLCVRDVQMDDDIIMTGTLEAAQERSVVPKRVPQSWADFLFHGMLFTGARGIVDLISSTYDSYEAFETISKYRFCADFLRARVFQTILSPGALLWSSKIDRLYHQRGRDERDHARRTRSPASCKDYVFNNDIDQWKIDVPDDVAWARFMYENGWSKALKFDSVQLKRRDLQPIFKPGVNDRIRMLLGVGGFLQDPVRVR